MRSDNDRAAADRQGDACSVSSDCTVHGTTVQFARTTEQPSASARRNASVPVMLAGHDPLRIIAMRTKWKEDYAC